MGTYVGNTLVAGATFNPTLLDFKWADHILNDVSWLRADTFSWQPGNVYQAVHNHLANEYSSAVLNLPVTVATQNAYLGNNKGGWRVVWDGTKFVAISAYGYVSTSLDGMTWEPATQNANLGNNDWCTIAYDGTKFVALGYDGHISTSTNGADWAVATQNANLGENKWSKILWDGTKFVALGYDGYISTSENGTIWAEATQNDNLSQGYGWYGLAYDGTKFVALGSQAHISTSTDCINWSVPVVNTNLGSANLWYGGLTYTGNGFIAVGWNGAISRSLDGVNWEPAVVDANLGYKNWSTIVYNGTKLLFVGNTAWLSETEFNTETIAGTTIEYCTAADGHKICPASEGSNVSAIYNATGVAWYYILDTVNNRFKLPRVNPDVVQYIAEVDIYGNGDYLRFMSGSDTSKGSYINSHTESLGSQTGWLRTYNSSGSLVNLGNMKLSDVKGESGIKADITKYFSGKKHLYFYVGNFTKSAIQQTAGITTEELNQKVDIGHQVVEFQAPTAANNYTWYRKYADGWVEQGGIDKSGTTGTHTKNLPIAMNSTNYTVLVGFWTGDTNAANYSTQYSIVSSTQIWIAARVNGSFSGTWLSWQVSGMAA